MNKIEIEALKMMIKDNQQYAENHKELKWGYDIVNKALQKQIPVKPSYENEHGEDMCSICNFGLNNILCEKYGDIEEITVKYCPNCGQRLEWRK